MNNLLARLHAPEHELVVECGRLAAARDARAFLVGGAVRDLVLGLSSPDIDIVVEGDAIAVAQDLARQRDGELTRHHAFQTATVDVPGFGRVDFATARSEAYRQPGALPVVEAGAIEVDLGRRDFTINTMALALAPESLGELLDPFDGADDIRGGLVRILHEQSFADDPTRVLRALRFALRFGYELEARTEQALRDAARGRFLRNVSGHRLGRELGKLLDEHPIAGPVALQEWDLLDACFPGLVVSGEALARVIEMADAVAEDEPRPALVLAALAGDLTPQGRWDLVRDLRLSKAAQTVVVDAGEPWREAVAAIKELPADAPRSTVAAVLDRLSPGAVLVGAALLTDAAVRGRVRAYLEKDRAVQPGISGNDLLAMGCEPGPRVGEVLAALRAARIDGAVTDAGAERDLARELVDP